MKVLWIALVLLVACSPADDNAPKKAAGTPPQAPPQTVSPSNVIPPQVTEERNITISGIETANPLVVAGLARTFENHVALRARDADGTVITEGFTTSNGEMGQHNPYRGSLWLTREPGPRIVVEALEYSAKDGAETNLARVEKPFDLEPVEAVLYFPDQNCTGVNPYTRRMPKSISMARLLMEALVHGPIATERASGAAVAFPEGSAVQSVILRDGVLTVDFNERLQNVGGSCRVRMIRASVTETSLRLPTVKKVVITAGGSEKLALQP